MNCVSMTTAVRLDGVLSLLMNSLPALLASFGATAVSYTHLTLPTIYSV